MNRTTIILLGLLMLACASGRARRQSGWQWLRQLSGSQKIFGVVAFVLVLLILLNPEFLALGLLGDSALFDMLVLAISLQLHTYVVRAGRGFLTVTARGRRWAGIPSPGFNYLLVVSAVWIGSGISAFQKVVHRFFS